MASACVELDQYFYMYESEAMNLPPFVSTGSSVHNIGNQFVQTHEKVAAHGESCCTSSTFYPLFAHKQPWFDCRNPVNTFT